MLRVGENTEWHHRQVWLDWMLPTKILIRCGPFSLEIARARDIVEKDHILSCLSLWWWVNKRRIPIVWFFGPPRWYRRLGGSG
jgi:hypothetical protein